MVGNDYLLQMDQFKALYEAGQKNGDSITLDVLTEFRNDRWQQSLSTNPYFFNGPFSGVVVTPAAYTFIYRFMANKSMEHPEGLLDGETLKSFFSITGDYPNFQYTAGHEKFPDNWYKRNDADAYTIPYLTLDALAMQVKYPEFLSVGGNTGTPNSFAGVEPELLTKGVFNTATLAEGNNAMCFGLQASVQAAPDLLSGLYADITPALTKLSAAVGAATAGLGCPKLESIDLGQFAKYPGYSNLKKDGTY